jgi:hypothetical protein
MCSIWVLTLVVMQLRLLPLAYWFLAWLTHSAWRWMRNVLPKRWLGFDWPHDVTLKNRTLDCVCSSLYMIGLREIPGTLTGFGPWFCNGVHWIGSFCSELEVLSFHSFSICVLTFLCCHVTQQWKLHVNLTSRLREKLIVAIIMYCIIASAERICWVFSFILLQFCWWAWAVSEDGFLVGLLTFKEVTSYYFILSRSVFLYWSRCFRALFPRCIHFITLISLALMTVTVHIHTGLCVLICKTRLERS